MARVWQEGYIASDDAILHGQPIIAGTRTPVRAIAEMWRMGVSPEEIQTQLPHLTLAQVFAALYGPGSADRFVEHAHALGLEAVRAAIPNLADDVDTLADLERLHLRVGPRTQVVLGELAQEARA